MRRFGLALVRDDRFVFDDAAAATLVDKLFRQASLVLIDGPPGDARSSRVRAFAQFIRLYRRHVRRLAAEDDGAWMEAPPPRGRTSVVFAVRNLPLELREALLVVALAGFSHREAAEALDLPLSALLDRLARARARVAAESGGERETAADALRPHSTHLRIVK